MNRKSITGWAVSALMILALGFLASFGFASFHDIERSDKYVTSTYSKYCYPSENPHPNMKKLIYYKTLGECGKPLNKR